MSQEDTDKHTETNTNKIENPTNLSNKEPTHNKENIVTTTVEPPVKPTVNSLKSLLETAKDVKVKDIEDGDVKEIKENKIEEAKAEIEHSKIEEQEFVVKEEDSEYITTVSVIFIDTIIAGRKGLYKQINRQTDNLVNFLGLELKKGNSQRHKLTIE